MCSGRSAWTPLENTYNHFLTFDLGERKKVKRIATLGRSRSTEYVTEYILQYSDDGELWRSVADNSAETQVIGLLTLTVNNRIIQCRF